ncbi:MAG: hypothetical protein H7Y17_15370 [Chlorobia bacterium]|nr:hypothetical protein [Fimbriimonadaceae bacterium]
MTTVGALAVFFGGSERDPPWMWGLFFIAFYGGILAGIVGLIAYIVLAVNRVD